MPTHHLQTKSDAPKPKEEICLFAQTNFRNQMIKFGIKTDDRRRHMYVIGKTGMGKTTMMENMVLHDIYNGHGVGIVDPHGDFAEKIINYIPPHRINDVVYLNPADVEHPIGFNIFEVQTEEQKHLIASGLMATFQKIWPDVWSSRMEYILNNTILALLDSPGSTLLGINRLLADKKYRQKVVRQLKDPVVKSFWVDEFANYEPRYAKEAVAPIQNKIGQFLSASVIRNMVAQVKSTINVRELMDSKKIFIMNLSKGRIGEDNSRLLGGMLINKIQLAAMERVDTPEEERKDFFLYVDEFQNFATPSFANILSEARKYRLSLIMAHQYVAQLDEVVADAVFGNVGTIVTFRIGAADAEALAKEFVPVFTEEHIVNLSKFHVLLKLMIDGVASQPFSATTMPPIGSPTDSAEKVIRVSRERYAKPKSVIEDKILRWSGMEHLADDGTKTVDIDTTIEPKKKKSKNKSDADNENNTKKKSRTKNKNKAESETDAADGHEKKYTREKDDVPSVVILSEAEEVVHIPEETISLSELSTREEKVDNTVDELHVEKKSPEQMLDEFISADDVETIKDTSTPANTTASSENVDTTQEQPKKKRRRRKRNRKKKKSEDTVENNIEHNNESNIVHEDIDTKKNERTSDTSTADEKPKKMSEDDIISFD